MITHLPPPLQAIAQSPLSQARLDDGTANPNTLYANYLLSIDNSFWKTLLRRVIGKVYGEYKILPSLKLNLTFLMIFVANRGQLRGKTLYGY
jgi:hypothetical protein